MKKLLYIVILCVSVAFILFRIATHLKPGGTPIDELYPVVHLDGGDGLVHVLGYDVATVEEAAGDVLAAFRGALDHAVSGQEAGSCDVGDGLALVSGIPAEHREKRRC